MIVFRQGETEVSGADTIAENVPEADMSSVQRFISRSR